MTHKLDKGSFHANSAVPPRKFRPYCTPLYHLQQRQLPAPLPSRICFTFVIQQEYVFPKILIFLCGNHSLKVLAKSFENLKKKKIILCVIPWQPKNTA